MIKWFPRTASWDKSHKYLWGNFFNIQQGKIYISHLSKNYQTCKEAGKYKINVWTEIDLQLIQMLELADTAIKNSNRCILYVQKVR